METTNYIALSRQAALKREMAVVAQNLANVDTPGYRGESMMFVEHLKHTQDGETGNLSFTQDLAMIQDLREGPMTRTGNPLDLAIRGDGYFTIETDDGPRYTRNGSFQLNEANEIVTHGGRNVLDDAGNVIALPPDAEHIEISRDGVISTENGQIATLDLASFENEQQLQKQADGLYNPGDAVVLPAEDAAVMQGMIEGSNVEGITEMTRMIDVIRSYQGASKLTEKEHERQLRAIRTLVSSQ